MIGISKLSKIPDKDENGNCLNNLNQDEYVVKKGFSGSSKGNTTLTGAEAKKYIEKEISESEDLCLSHFIMQP